MLAENVPADDLHAVTMCAQMGDALASRRRGTGHGTIVGGWWPPIFGRARWQFKVCVRRPALSRRGFRTATAADVAILLVLATSASRPTLAQNTSVGPRRPLVGDSLVLAVPPAFGALGRLGEPVPSLSVYAEEQEQLLRKQIRAREVLFLAERLSAAGSRRGAPPVGGPAGSGAGIPTRRPASPFADYADLGLQLDSRLEVKAERDRNDRCQANQLFDPLGNCHGSFNPNLDFQFVVKSGGVVADRVHVNVDYQTQREFESSNNISVYYQGKRDEILQRLEVGNVSFAPPPSRYLTSGIPSGNYGVQALGQFGPMRFRTIVAQQKGNVVRDRVFSVGDRTLQGQDRELEDYQVEPRRFFFTVDPRRLAGYPNIDILDGQRMGGLAQALPDSVRPRKIFLYRLRIGAAPADPNGPQFFVRGLENSSRGQPYEYLREGVDYYVDPSQLWVALVNPAQLNGDRIVLAYTVRVGGRDTTSSAGGTPDLRFVKGKDQTANLIYDPTTKPGDDAFFREIRSVYRIGGEDVVRNTLGATVVAGASGTQEKPAGGGADSYLQLFGLAQRTDATRLDVENHVWPRPSDPNLNLTAGTTGTRLIRDYFLVFPSLRPFASTGLAGANPANDTLYSTPSEYLYTSQHPPTIYRIRARYQSLGGSDAGSLDLGAVQLRRNSERVVLDGRALTRDVDYRIDYDLGRITFARSDTLFARPRQVSVQYEENPLFTASPTNIVGVTTAFPTENGQVSFTAISQSQSTQFTRPALGLEPAASFIAGVTANFSWEAEALTRALNHLPLVATSAPSSITFSGELATSRPRPNAAGQAYLESFEGDNGVPVSLTEQSWYYSSQPATGTAGKALSAQLQSVLDTTRAATLAWQNAGLDSAGRPVIVTIANIDTLTKLVGSTFIPYETVLWMTLYPLSIGGRYDPTAGYRWTIAGTPSGPRWRSIRTVLSPSGLDLSRAENVEFWALIDTSTAGRTKDPTLVFDFGDISERTVFIGPDTLIVPQSTTSSPADSAYRGRRFVRPDVEASERDPRTKTFNADVNDTGLPGDVMDVLHVEARGPGGLTPRADLTNFPTCVAAPGQALRLGDARADCTVRNNRLDEEDIDLDYVLNFGPDRAQRDAERILRYAVDLGNRASYDRVGVCDRAAPAHCWVHFRVPLSVPTDSLNAVSRRRIRALRLTMVSGPGLGDADFSQVPLARLRLTGAPWLKRGDRPLLGVGGSDTLAGVGGFVRVSTVGTNDSSATLEYESPPGVTDQADTKTASYRVGAVQINEHSLRIQAGQLPLYGRAEGYYRFPEGEKNFMGYRQLRLWGRGRGSGWGPGGELELFVRLGRDPNNFYLYRTPVQAGRGANAWLPEVGVDFRRFFALRARLQNAYLKHTRDTVSCSGTDLALVLQSPLPVGTRVSRYAACDDGFIVYTTDPAVSPPNLAAVQEIAVGIVRVRGNAAPTVAGDTLELWVDDIRLADVVDTPGYAGQVGVSIVAGDVANVRVNFSRRDPNFRQLGEQPTFVTDGAAEVISTLRLDKFLPRALGFELPFTVTHTTAGHDPLFISRSDLRGDAVEGLRTPRSSTTTYGISVRRTAPLTMPILGPLAGPLLNNLAVTGGYTTADDRTEFGIGAIRNTTIGADYLVTPNILARQLPFWLGGALLGDRAFRLVPSALRFSTSLVRATDARTTFLKPAAAVDDSASVAHGEQRLWRNAGGVEWRPTEAISARWDVQSLRDLRRYPDSTANGVVAGFERERLLGRDIGLERERAMTTLLTVAPEVRPWFRPRFDAGTSYSMIRDPNASSLVRSGDATSTFHLPRRLTNTQTATVGLNFDLAEALLSLTGPRGFFRALAAIVQPVDLTIGRNLLSLVDGTPVAPTLGFQFALGGPDAFRLVGGRPATSAALTNTVTLNNGLLLPLGAAVVNRYNRVTTRNWTRRTDTTVAVVDGYQRTFPDLSLRWTGRPTLLGDLFTSIGAQAGYRSVRASTVAPSGIGGDLLARSSSHVLSYPVNASVAWGYGSGLSTAAGFTATRRDDQQTGGTLDRSATDEMTIDVGKAFAAPAGLGLKSDIRTRVAYQDSRTRSYVYGLTDNPGAATRTADNGRRAFSLNADTDFDQNVTFSLQGSQIVTSDANLNRRFTQTVITASMHLAFFAGELH
ncbi:MAG: hypothetical protein NVS4B3_17180 [Gemmatimonadaceae bacterium]